MAQANSGFLTLKAAAHLAGVHHTKMRHLGDQKVVRRVRGKFDPQSVSEWMNHRQGPMVMNVDEPNGHERMDHGWASFDVSQTIDALRRRKDVIEAAIAALEAL